MERCATVTGATGFLGGALARRLLQDGWRVVATGRNPGAGAELQRLGAEFYPADLADGAAVVKDSVVFHCAARSSPWGSRRDFQRANILGTANVVEACRVAGVSRLVHVSTPGIYFDFKDAESIPEDAPTPGRANLYTRTKLRAERIVDESGLPTVTLRPRAIFGPGDTTLFPRLIRAHGPKGFPLIGPGDPLIDVTYVENVVEALLLAAEAPVTGRKFNITNGEPWPRSELLRTVFESTGIAPKFREVSRSFAMNAAACMELGSILFTSGRWEPLLTRYTVGVMSATQTLDISAARRFLGYVPRVTVAEGLQRFGEWWRAGHGG